MIYYRIEKFFFLVFYLEKKYTIYVKIYTRYLINLVYIHTPVLAEEGS